MKSSEVFRWCYRHNIDFEFKSVAEGCQVTVTTKRKGIFTQHKLLLRNHDTAADELCRFAEKLSTELNLE